jgi:uncharacterized protein YecT (DUF1311 family)
MMRPLSLSIVIGASVLQLWACDKGARDETAAAMRRDSSLAYDLKLASADTAPFSDAADVAVADRAGSLPMASSVPPMVESDSASSSPSTRVISNPSRKSSTTEKESSGAVGAKSGGDVSTKATDEATERSGGTSRTASSPSAEDFAGPSCASPALADQRRCLLSYLAHSDVTLDRNYQALITQLKREAGAPASGKEPATVLRLRTAQRNWLVYRDNECRRRNEGKEGPLWAPTRAQCLAEYSGQRAKELANALSTRSNTSAVNARSTGAVRAKSTPTKRSKQVAAKQSKRKRS